MNIAPPAPSWITIADAAERLSVSPKTIRRMISRGDLVGRRLPNSRLIRIDAAQLDTLGRDLAVSYA
jgi:excisionase family DNA binding protein